jgi:hypothetical protein
MRTWRQSRRIAGIFLLLVGSMLALRQPGSSAHQREKAILHPAQTEPSAVGKKAGDSQPEVGFILPFEAVAPKKRLKEIKVVQIKGKHHMFDGSRAARDFVMTWEGVERTKVDQTEKGFGRLKLNRGKSLTLLLIRDQGWVALGANQRRLDGDGLGFYQNSHYSTVLSNLIALTAEGFTVVPVGDATVRGKRCFAVMVKRAGKPDLKMFFDKETKLLFKTEFKGRFLDQALRFQRFETFVEFFFSDYKPVNGINHWHVREQWRNGRKAWELVLSEVRFLTKRDDSLFYFPPFDAEVKKALAAGK